MSVIHGENDKAVIVYEEGLDGERLLSSTVETTLRRASQAYRVLVAPDEPSLNEQLISCDPVLLIVDADRSGGLDIERMVASLRAGPMTRWLPVLAMVTPQKLGSLHESLRLSPVDFILKPFDHDELWGRIRVNLHNSAALSEFQRRNEELTRRSVTDGLTGLFNARHVFDRCDQEMARAKRYGHPVSCLLVDVDRFKAVNDTYGHLVGNEVLRGLAALLRDNVRGSDTVGRFGGEEFLLVLPETGLEGAMILAERLRRAVEAATFSVGEHSVRITASIGAATYPSKGILGRETLFRAVDRAAYRAKQLGRNRVACSEEDSASPGRNEPEDGEVTAVE